MKFIADNLEETKNIAKNFVSEIKKHEKAVVIGLYGDLGAGKTSFVQGVASYFGIEENISSPTFVIEKIYNIEDKNFSKMIHIDAYRIEKSSEILKLGWKDIISDPNNIILIEWPEIIKDIIPEHIKINLSYFEDNKRQIEIMI